MARRTFGVRFQPFSLVVVLYGAGIIAALLALIASGHGDRPYAMAGLLAALFVAAEHRDRVYSDETGMSGSIAVGLCAATYAGSQSWIWGTFFICAAGGLYVPQLRLQSWTKILVNAMCFGASGAAAASTVHAVVSIGGLPKGVLLAVAGPIAVGAYWASNSALLAAASSSLSGNPVRDVAMQLIRSETVMLAFAMGGAICGLVMVEVSRWAGLAALVALLVALDVFVISVPAGPTTLRHAWRQIVSRVVGATMAAAVAAAIPKLVASAVVGAILGGVLGLAVGLATVTLVALLRLRLARTRMDRRVLLGFVVAEVALPAIGATGGVVGALAGAGAGIITAAGLVVIASLAAAWWRRSPRDDPEEAELVLAMVTEAMFDGLPHPSHRG